MTTLPRKKTGGSGGRGKASGRGRGKGDGKGRGKAASGTSDTARLRVGWRTEGFFLLTLSSWVEKLTHVVTTVVSKCVFLCKYLSTYRDIQYVCIYIYSIYM